MQLTLTILSAAISLYLLLLFIRILLTWFQGVHLGRLYDYLVIITDPYLNFFRRHNPFKSARMDFSAVIAMVVLLIPLQILNQLIGQGSITLGLVLAIILISLWRAVRWIMGFFAILIVIRLIAHVFRVNSVSPFIQTLDMITSPILSWVNTKFFKKRILSLQTGLILSAGTLIVLILLLNSIMNILAGLLFQIPI